MHKSVIALLLGCFLPSFVLCTEDQCLNCSQSMELIPAVSSLDSSHFSSCSLGGSENQCPPGLFCNNGTCKCGHYTYPYIVKCDRNEDTSAILHCNCASVDWSMSRGEVTFVGPCIYTCEHFNASVGSTTYRSLMNTTAHYDSICSSFNRTGALCGKCLPEHYPLAYSFDVNCIKCPHVGWNWGRYIMAAYLPLTLFCFVIFFFQINVVTSHLHPVIWCSQVFSFPASSQLILLSMQSLHNLPEHLLLVMKIVYSLHGIWNFDFFRPFYCDICLGIDILPTLALDYAIAVYPLLLMAITYLRSDKLV